MAKPTKETLEHRKAFDLYLSMGANRSLSEVGRQISKSVVAIQGWSSAFGWQTRIEEAEKRIADKASAKVEESLADFDAETIRIADAVIELFTQSLREAFDKDGNIDPLGFRPSAKDARLFIDLKRERMAKAGGDQDAGRIIDADAVEGLGYEKIERIVTERIERIARFRKRGNP